MCSVSAHGSQETPRTFWVIGISNRYSKLKELLLLTHSCSGMLASNIKLSSLALSLMRSHSQLYVLRELST